jgi:hypothetical protein
VHGISKRYRLGTKKVMMVNYYSSQTGELPPLHRRCGLPRAPGQL